VGGGAWGPPPTAPAGWGGPRRRAPPAARGTSQAAWGDRLAAFPGHASVRSRTKWTISGSAASRWNRSEPRRRIEAEALAPDDPEPTIASARCGSGGVAIWAVTVADHHISVSATGHRRARDFGLGWNPAVWSAAGATARAGEWSSAEPRSPAMEAHGRLTAMAPRVGVSVQNDWTLSRPVRLALALAAWCRAYFGLQATDLRQSLTQSGGRRVSCSSATSNCCSSSRYRHARSCPAADPPGPPEPMFQTSNRISRDRRAPPR
jgi:hypothetical protein